jgi:hypothetical protein
LIKVRGGNNRFTSDGVVFAGGREEKFDATIPATGFRPDLRRLIPGVDDVFDVHGMPRVTGRATDAPGLYFCGHITSRTGQFARDRHRGATDRGRCEAVSRGCT